MLVLGESKKLSSAKLVLRFQNIISNDCLCKQTGLQVELHETWQAIRRLEKRIWHLTKRLKNLMQRGEAILEEESERKRSILISCE